MTGRLVPSGRTRSGTAREHLAWLGAGLVMGFVVPFVFADVLRLPRDVYYGVYIAAVLLNGSRQPVVPEAVRQVWADQRRRALAGRRWDPR